LHAPFACELLLAELLNFALVIELRGEGEGGADKIHAPPATGGPGPEKPGGISLRLSLGLQ